MNELGGHPNWHPHFPGGISGDGDGYRKDLHSHLWGLVLALTLTAVPFALVYWHAMTRSWLLLAIGIFALVQAMVHFRFFLDIHPPHRNVDQLLLVLFSAQILIMMAGGTVWILANLHSRMY